MPLHSRDVFSDCVGNVLIRFPGVRELNEYQSDGLFNLETGFGKSLIFQLVPWLCLELHNIGYTNFPKNAIMLVLCSLVALNETHMNELEKRGNSCVCLTSEEATQHKSLIVDGKSSFVFANPESVILNENWRKML